MAKSLSVLSRGIVNRNVKLEGIDLLPIPRSIKDNCFANVAVDRYPKEHHLPPSSTPCDCCSFSTSDLLKNTSPFIWSEKIRSDFGLDNFYLPTLPELETDAEWIQLPDRESLLKSYLTMPWSCERKFLEACLNPLRFHPSTGLGMADKWIKRYLYFRKIHGWYRISIRPNHFKKFLEMVKSVPLVVLPYGHVSDDDAYGIQEEEICLKRYKRVMIVVVKNDDKRFKDIFDVLKAEKEWWDKEHILEISDASYFINSIVYVSLPTFASLFRRNFRREPCEYHYMIFNPVVDDAMWWMLLLVPHAFLDKYVNCKIFNDNYKKNFYKRKREKKFCIYVQLNIQNCVVQFDPLYQCIGDEVPNLRKHVKENRPFVYWLEGRVLNVEKVKDLPSFSEKDSKREFIEWCVSRKMNTLMNLNGDYWIKEPDSFDDEDYF